MSNSSNWLGKRCSKLERLVLSHIFRQIEKALVCPQYFLSAGAYDNKLFYGHTLRFFIIS
jgi:hypothetical protein